MHLFIFSSSYKENRYNQPLPRTFPLILVQCLLIVAQFPKFLWPWPILVTRTIRTNKSFQRRKNQTRSKKCCSNHANRGHMLTNNIILFRPHRLEMVFSVFNKLTLPSFAPFLPLQIWRENNYKWISAYFLY